MSIITYGASTQQLILEHIVYMRLYVSRNYAPNLRRIRYGTTYRLRGGTINYVEKEFNHPSFDLEMSYDGDITVVRLRRPIIYSTVATVATLIYHGARILDNIPVVHAGWGDTIVRVN